MQNIPSISLDLIQTVGLAAFMYWIGILVRRKINFIDKLNIPAAVIGGLIFANINLFLRDRIINITFNTSMQQLLMIAFFATIGISASVPLLKKGGVQVIIFLFVSTIFCFLQNFIGMGVARFFGVNELLGVIAGSVTLVGGPATGMAFAPIFESMGVVGAGTIAITAATFGIVCGGIIGGPIGTRLISKYKLATVKHNLSKEATEEISEHESYFKIETEKEDSALLKTILLLGVVMAVGSVVSFYFQSLGLTLPAYIGAMIVASVVRNIDDTKKIFNINLKGMDIVGTISLNIFLVVALMDLKLWELVHLALPLTVILVAQTLTVAIFVFFILFYIMGRDYDSAVISSGFVGFVLGTTANAVANMKTLVSKYGASPKAFLIVPMVGAFFIDFTNALIITYFLNLFK